MVPARPFFMGTPGWVRSRAWIWLLSSMQSTSALSGGLPPPVWSLTTTSLSLRRSNHASSTSAWLAQRSLMPGGLGSALKISRGFMGFGFGFGLALASRNFLEIDHVQILFHLKV